MDIQRIQSPFLQQAYCSLAQIRSATTAALYVNWMRRYILFHRFRSVAEMSGDVTAKIQAFLVSLHASANTQNQALCALLALYNDILEDHIEHGWQTMKARRKRLLPVILSRPEAQHLFEVMAGGPKFMAQMLYGSGLKVSECASLRICQIDFAHKKIQLKGHWTLLAQTLAGILQRRIAFISGCYRLKGLLDESQYFLFPESNLFDPDTEICHYRHIHQSALQKAVHLAAQKAQDQGLLLKPVSCQSLRDSFAVEILNQGGNIRQVQEFLGIKDIRQCLRYVRCLPICKP